ncbi:MAG: histidine kinase [Clostridium butyricum]|jgi:sensor histidine kinase YesM|nr:histidine kinase [Clostridium butyricum]
MIKRIQRKSGYSIKHRITLFIYISIPVIIINILVSLFSILIIRQQNIDYISNTIKLFQGQTLAKLNTVEHFVLWSAVNEPLIKTMETTNNYSEMTTSISNFRTRVADSQYSTGQDYQYFLNLNDKNLFLNCSSLQISYSDYQIVKSFFLDLIKENRSISDNCKWRTLKINDSLYFYYYVTYCNRTFITLVSAEDILKPLKNVNVGKNGSIVMIDDEGQLISSTFVNETYKYKKNSLYLNYLIFDKFDSKLPFTLQVYVDNFGNFEKIISVQVIMVLMAFTIAITIYLFVLDIHNKVIKPIQNFSLNLSNINDNTNLLDFQNSNILELEMANEQFKNLLYEIKRLKINIYEHELDKKKIQINFLQHQIRPHFYLNCLTTIYSMAQLEKYNDIESMVLYTSGYLRYLFQTNKDFVNLEYELNHISDYLSIQALRYGSTFSYTCTVEENITQLLIPPLILMTFVENTIKHCMSLEENLEINLSIKKQIKNNKNYICFLLKDTGPGFPKQILNILNTNKILIKEDGTCIGISNAIQRLSLLYDDNYELYFFNNEIGATVKLVVPYYVKGVIL